jgi:YVTN family beta-propeller protein
MNSLKPLVAAAALAVASLAAAAASNPGDRVYTADQNTNTISVVDPTTNTLLGQIKLGNQRPDVLSPLYKGEINVHGLGFSPDHRTLLAIANGSNSVTFIDTATNKVKGITYVGRSPHEAFFTRDGKEVWAVVRGENYVSVIDAKTFKEKRRIETAPGPGMVLFTPDGGRAFVVSSFSPEVAVVDTRSYQIVKRIPVVSPFSPFLQLTPDGQEIWMGHKDVGKVTRIDVKTMAVTGVIDTGFITNHLGFAETARGTLAYVAVGGENVVKVFSTDREAKLLNTIATGALPHGVWPSDDGTRMYVGLENGDAIQVIETGSDKVIATVPVGQAPQALVYVSNAVPSGAGTDNLKPLANAAPANIPLVPTSGEAKGFVVARSFGVVDALEVFLYKLKPETVYSVFVGEQAAPVASFKTNPMGMANGTAIGPIREVARLRSEANPTASRIVVVEGEGPMDASKAVLHSPM